MLVGIASVEAAADTVVAAVVAAADRRMPFRFVVL